MWQISLKAYGQVAPDGLFELWQVEESYVMANEEHLARLKQGVKAWHEWQAMFKPDRYRDLTWTWHLGDRHPTEIGPYLGYMRREDDAS